MNWSDLFNEVRPHVPGCPDVIIEDAIRNAAAELCRRSHCWEEQLPNIYPAASVTRYSVSLPEGAELLSVASLLHVNGDSKSALSFWPAVNVFGLLTFAVAPETNRGPIEIKGVLVPSREATSIPDRIGQHYREGIIGGAVGRLQMIPGKDWTNPQFAPVHLQALELAILEAKSRKYKGNTDRAMRVYPRQFI
jgi:hypothetical protein